MRGKRNIIILKFGGTSVGDADRIKKVADKIISASLGGNKVVAAVSAMGDTTDKFIELAGVISSDPSRREMDMLMSTGERLSAQGRLVELHRRLDERSAPVDASPVGFPDDVYSNA